MKAIFYGFQFPHHGSFSAFNGFCESLRNVGVEVVDVPWPRLPKAWGFRRLHRLLMRYHEQRLRARMVHGNYDLVHYFFPENSLFKMPRHGAKLILTLHQPGGEAYLEKVRTKTPWLYDAIQQADGIILMAPDDLEIYQEFAPKSRVVYLPHGIDTHFFDPGDVSFVGTNKRKKVLAVGGMLRDYSFWARTVQEVLALTHDVDFVVVAGRASLKEALTVFGGSLPSRVQWMSGISDQELRKQYAESDLFFLPLYQAWANNALLEASSMGVPIMVTDLVATRAYLGESGIFFQNGDAVAIANQLIHQLGKDTRQLRQALRRRMVEEYEWDVIAKHQLRFYEEIAAPCVFK